MEEDDDSSSSESEDENAEVRSSVRVSRTVVHGFILQNDTSIAANFTKGQGPHLI